MFSEIVPTNNKIIIKIWDADRELRHKSEGGIITTHTLNPILDYCQIGSVVTIGKNVKTPIQKDDIVLFSWMAEDDEKQHLGKDDTGEFRYVTEKQIYGTIKVNVKTGNSRIEPKKNYIVCEPIGDDFSLTTKGIFQIPIAGINPEDKVARKMGCKAGAWALCERYSAVPITIKRKIFFFICIEDIILLNYGEHKIQVNRKKVFKDLIRASRNEKVALN